MTHDEVKKQLMSKVDDIVNALVHDKTIELKKEKDIVKVFDVTKKKLN